MGLTEVQEDRLRAWKERRDHTPVVLKNGESQATIRPLGCQIHELILYGEKILGSYDFDLTSGHPRIRGIGSFLQTPAVRVCGDDHGLGWGRRWVVNGHNQETATLFTRFSTSPTSPLEVTQTHRLGPDKGYSVRVTHKNMGTTNQPISPGVHLYFDAPEGILDGKMSSGDDQTTDVVQFRDVIDEFTQGESVNLIELDRINRVHLPGKNVICLEQNGFSYACISVVPKGFDYDHRCIRITPFRKTVEPVVLEPGNTHRARITLTFE